MERRRVKPADLQEKQREAPNLEVACWSYELAPSKVFWLSIHAITVDAADNESAFLLAQEVPCFVCFIWKVHHEHESQYANQAGNYA